MLPTPVSALLPGGSWPPVGAPTTPSSGGWIRLLGQSWEKGTIWCLWTICPLKVESFADSSTPPTPILTARRFVIPACVVAAACRHPLELGGGGVSVGYLVPSGWEAE